MHTNNLRKHLSARVKTLIILGVIVTLVACGSIMPRLRQGWNPTYGPVVPHDTFPSDCSLCHTGKDWHTIKEDFSFDHLKETGVALNGAHAKVACLMCHNDRGAVGVFAAQGCSGCHEDVHKGKLGRNCGDCHVEQSWLPNDIVARHARTRFPLVGRHAGTACFRCHTGTETGDFDKPNSDCVGCHQSDLTRATSPDHIAQGWTGDCQRCHSPTSFTPAQFIHPSSFPLTAGHSGRACNVCHTQPGTFTGLSTSCDSCHLPDYQATNNPNHTNAGFATTCNQCHNTAGWTGANFIHTSAFPLTGGHAGRSCNSCHAFGIYGGTSPECVSCHMEDYARTTNPNHAAGGFGTTCNQCHNTTQWRSGTNFSHPATFPLTAGHAGVGCTTCHTTGVFTGLSTACNTCHLPDYQSTANPNHTNAGFPQTCNQCHNTAGWTGVNFVHTSAFPLTGGHAGRDCITCHTSGTYTGLSIACNSCHLSDFQATTNPNHVNAGFAQTCQTCHNTTGWTGANFVHTSQFPLTGAHAGHACTTCHTGGAYSGLTNQCSSCHLDDYNRTVNPNHVTSGFGTTCNQCHGTTQWAGATFTHPATFPLTAGHAGQTCSACHTGGVFTGLSTACNSCHLPDFQGTTNPNHVNAGFAQTCQTCHNTAGWTGANFVHTSAFPLTSGHAGRTCNQCHTGSVYTGLSNQCSSCHLDDFQRTTNPNHVTSGFSQNCVDCHNTSQWQGANFVHPATFPLTAGHGGLGCTVCHTTGVYTGLNRACASCHTDEFQRTTDPNHQQAAFATTCNTCHNTTTWQTATYTHITRFPLTAGHAGRQCVDCHASGVYRGLSALCSSCHLDDFQQTTNPNHQSAGFPTTCNTCHTTTTWQTGAFTHTTRFPLTNGHSGLNCSQCHVGGVFTGTSSLCSSCHTDTFNGTTNPRHSSAGFATTCNTCHNTTTWQTATWTHTTRFPLTNGHSGRTCNECHGTGVYAGTSGLCASCHTDTFNGTTNPRHSSAGFATTCNTCHNTTTWNTATWTHPTSFPLTGAHAAPTCNQCHTANNYANLSATCVTCHLSDYQSTTNPNHASSGFGTDCAACHHSNTTWDGATFNHTQFNITNNRHRAACTVCHTNSSNYSVFTCLVCHAHNQTDMANQHRNRSGYQYNSNACYSCHPRG